MTSDFGCYSLLWAEAVEWALQGPGSTSKSISRNFRRWWLRAAIARGHAEWLIEERAETREPGHIKPIEAWRLQYPGSVGHYDNDCGIVGILFLQFPRDTPFPGYVDDEYGTLYNITQTVARETQNEAYGWPFNSFTYGAPVSSYVLYRTYALTIMTGLCVL